MLVLTRGKGEKIRIGKNGDIILQVVEVRGSQVRLGIQAPNDIPIHREEVFARIEEKAEQE